MHPQTLSIACLLGFSAAAAVAYADVPKWINGIQPVSMGIVASVQPSQQGDVVVLAGGQDQGMRPGMHCLVRRGDRKVADLVIVAAREDRSAALILSSDETPQMGDIVKIKTF